MTIFKVKRIDDYIQGETTTNMAANMISMAGTGNPALQFANVDAELYGMDVEWGYELGGDFRLDGTVSYVRGRRRDSGDNLYRIAPLNTRAQLTYEQASWSVSTELEAYAAQNDVAEYNEEQKSSGYGLLHLRGQMYLADSFKLGLGVENVFDRGYEDHTTAINRAVNSDVAVGDKVPGSGRNIYVTANYEW